MEYVPGGNFANDVLKSELAKEARSMGRVKVVEQPPEGDSCVRMVTLDGGGDTTVVVQARTIDDAKAPW